MAKLITSDVEYVRAPLEDLNTRNPNQEWKNTAYRWSVTLKTGSRNMVVEFYTGAGRPSAPETHEVVNCLASESSCCNEAATFEEWASSLGCDTDSRKAEALYRKIVDQTELFQAFLGDDFDMLDLDDEDRCKEFCV